MIDIGDSRILDCREINIDEMKEILGVSSRNSVEQAIQSKRIPPEFDRNGTGGARRWFVGQIRAWLNVDMNRAINEMKGSNPARFKLDRSKER